MENILLLMATILICYWCWKYLTTRQKLPPGPIGIPILGYLPFLSAKTHVDFSNLKQKYGNVFSLYVGEKLVVILSSYNVIKEAFQNQGDVFSGRANGGIPPEFIQTKGIIFNEGKPWLEVKNFVVNCIKKYVSSDGKGKLIAKNEITHFLHELKKMDGIPTNIYNNIHISISNILWVFLFGERNDYNDEKFQEIITTIHEHVSRIKFAGVEIAFPWIYKIPFISKWIRSFAAYETYRKSHKLFQNKLQEMVEKLTYNNNDDLSVTSEWFKERQENINLSESNLIISILIDLVITGTNTLTIFLQWAVLYMAEYPKIQEKVQQEIDNVVGDNRTPSMADLKQMPFTNAVIMEIHRIVTLIPIMSHANTDTTTLEGYVIPENSLVISNFWDHNHNPDLFPNPHEFLPERFIENGELKKHEELLIFSIGKRQCMGELYARMVIFLYFTSMLQNFTFKKYVTKKLEIDYKFMPLIYPRPQKIYVEGRHESIIS